MNDQKLSIKELALIILVPFVTVFLFMSPIIFFKRYDLTILVMLVIASIPLLFIKLRR